MIKTKNYYADCFIFGAALALAFAVLFVLPSVLKTSVPPPAAQEYTVTDENEIIMAYGRGYVAGINQGWEDAYANMIETANSFDYNPAYIAPERKPR